MWCSQCRNSAVAREGEICIGCASAALPEVDDPITCACNDPECPQEGFEGEVAHHIEKCSCRHCHQEMGSVL